jgi:phage shock protein E
MINLLESIFGKKADLQELILNGATIIDVRTNGEFQGGHLRNSINIPLDKLNSSLGKLNKNKPIITCCASGARSASAMNFLKSNGFSQVYNGGSWTGLKKFKSLS